MKWRLFLIVMALLVSGCNENQGQQRDNNVAPNSLAPLKYVTVPPNQPENINITNLTHGRSVVELNLLEGRRDSCELFSFSHEDITATVEKGEVCVFDIVSKGTDAKLSSNYVFISTYEDKVPQLLNTISITTRVHEELLIDIKDQLGEISSPPVDYHLLGTAYLVSEEGDLTELPTDTLSESITYTPVDSGVSRIIYAYQNADKDTMFGIIYISTSEDNNINFTTATISIDVSTGEDVTFDLADLVSKGEHSGDVFLADVMSFDDEYLSLVTDTGFVFTPKYAEQSVIYYAVIDNKGGVSSNRIVVNASGSMEGLDNIDLVDKHFTYTYVENVEEAIVNGHAAFSSTSYGDGSNSLLDVEYPLYEYKKAKSTCLMRNMRLPTQDDLMLLFGQEGNLFSGKNSQQWPVSAPYIADDGSGEGILVNMQDGVPGGTGFGYLTCIRYSFNTIEILESIVPDDSPRQLHVSAKMDDYRVPIEPVITSWDVSDSSIAEISSTGILTPKNVGLVDVTAKEESGLTTTKTILIARNWLYKNEDGSLTGQDPYFNDSAEAAGLFYSTDIDGGACTLNYQEFNRLTGFVSESDGTKSDFIRLCSGYGSKSTYSGRGMAYLPAIGGPGGAGAERFLGKIESVSGKSRLILSGAFFIKDSMEDKDISTTIANFQLVQPGKPVGEVFDFTITKPYTEGGNVDITFNSASYIGDPSKLIDSHFDYDEANGWVYFEFELEPSAPLQALSSLEYRATGGPRIFGDSTGDVYTTLYDELFVTAW
ncbi:hypothetical protein [Vibrio owensii]|uniref:hypothetical protein n=1 Tax=Vibrio owensii TaxID=696485 RepID=UPI0003A98502|nr:hypothetical protein [Vibrio owensii]